jgi:hypothetical protein
MTGVDVDTLVARLDAIPADDPERAHSLADQVLADAVDPQVREAYTRVGQRCGWWATA